MTQNLRSMNSWSDINIVSLGFPFRASPKGFYNGMLGRGFHTQPNQCEISQSTPLSGPSVLASTRSFLQSMWDPHQIHPLRSQRPYWHTASCLPLRGTTSSLAHCPVFGSDTICNGLGPLLADIVLFGLSFSGFPSRFLKRVG